MALLQRFSFRYLCFIRCSTTIAQINSIHLLDNESITKTVKALCNIDSTDTYGLIKQRDNLFANSSSNVNNIKPIYPTSTFSLAPFINSSACLINLVKLGVDISNIETKYKEVAEYLIQANFETDIKPRLLLLHQFGVKDDELKIILSKNPNIFKTDICDMQTRLRYFESKNFEPNVIARILSKAPDVLTQSTAITDSHLGYLQKEFKLTG